MNKQGLEKARMHALHLASVLHKSKEYTRDPRMTAAQKRVIGGLLGQILKNIGETGIRTT